jgi:hypothetical protein
MKDIFIKGIIGKDEEDNWVIECDEETLYAGDMLQGLDDIIESNYQQSITKIGDEITIMLKRP